MATRKIKRLKLSLAGQIQGVGFRPFVYRLALQHMLSGHVSNHPSGVIIEVQGTNKALTSFHAQLVKTCPPHAIIENITQEKLKCVEQEQDFKILPSDHNYSEAITKLVPDLASCKDCIDDLFNPLSRYYLYPFVNCTYCGPRYSITKNMPYDRHHTTMADFTMCSDCQTEYTDPLNRRFHAQPIACEQCGPSLNHSLNAAAKALLNNKVIAVKSLGGFQLIALSHRTEAITTLRKLKNRPQKPLALMALNLASIKSLCHTNQNEAHTLQSTTHPIVLLKRRKLDFNSCLIAPKLNRLGMMLAYTPIHYLLFYYLMNQPQNRHWLHEEKNIYLAVTSANPHGEPMVINNKQAQDIFDDKVGLIVNHNREIYRMVDDSVVIASNNIIRPLRRARGFSPKAISIPYNLPNTLGLGSYLKNTICVIKDNEAFLSPYIGTLNNQASKRLLKENIDTLLKYLNIKLDHIIYDRSLYEPIEHIIDTLQCPSHIIQHHQAHLHGCAIDNQLTNNYLALALDGLGYGPDTQLRGGELYFYDGKKYIHLSQLAPMPLPGGDVASKEPWRMALSLSMLSKENYQSSIISDKKIAILKQCITNQINAPSATSCGRFFDGISSLLGICHYNTFEGEAAMKLESCFTERSKVNNDFIISQKQLSLLPIIPKLKTLDPNTGSNYFHTTLVLALAEWIKHYADIYNCQDIVLSGGCFANTVLSELLSKELSYMHLNAYLPKTHPVNDSGLSFGQAILGAQQCV